MVRRKKSWPEWWSWDFELSPHIEKRMEQRGVSEHDLREMLHTAGSYREDAHHGRWVVECRRGSSAWEIVVEPDFEDQVIVGVTVYRVDE